MRIAPSKERGNVLLITLIVTGIVASSLLGYLSFVESQQIFTGRSASWGQALPFAEAGIEEALTHINYLGTTNLGTYGWNLAGGAFGKQRALVGGYYVVNITTSAPPSITATGYARAPLQTNYIVRAVQVSTQRITSGSLIAINSVTMSGGASVDGFDSSNPLYSTNGVYLAGRATDTAYVGVMRGAANVINTGTARIYGRAATGPGGSATGGWGGGIGTHIWLATASGPGPIQPGYFTPDLNTAVPAVSIPFTNGYAVPGAGMVNGTNYDLVLNGGDFQLPSVSLSGIQKVIVTVPSRFYVTGNLTIGNGASLSIKTNASLQLYVGGPQVDLTGAGILNGAQTMNALTLYGLPGLTNILAGNGTVFSGIILAPQANLQITGSGNVSGSAFVNAAILGGSGAFHCDNSLGSSNLKYVIATWTEL